MSDINLQRNFYGMYGIIFATLNDSDVKTFAHNVWCGKNSREISIIK